LLDKATPELCSAKGFERKYDIMLLLLDYIIKTQINITTGSSYWYACGKMCALFREHTYSSGAICGSRISSGFLNGKETNVSALNTSSDS
jgi:hypothetical protein